ncbi:unnamed protein product [Macrosiphum euphorbiae]|uniref:HAT C-terminal dimerisation domain-containing protein n=1 Tax=Macrosiphum euphorbiae TaxID=13131 RepID=A0AAV0XC40_9HEMI|nr:unnamed protein product [Macrosiphum euphorbiae]
MKNQTRGVDYLDVITNFLDDNDIDIEKLVCVCTDGCPSMTGCEKGFISLLKKKYNLTNILSFHCIIHQENLAARVSIPEVDLVMKNVINIIELKNDTNLEAIFKEKREQKEYIEFWNLVPGKYKTLQKCAHFLMTMFTSTYLCETSYSKMKYAKNVYRNRLTDSHLDDLLRVACSNYKPDMSKIVKKLSQFQNSH